MDQLSLNVLARKAIAELELPCEVAEVVREPERKQWSVRFTPGYGQLSDTFRNRTGDIETEDEILLKLKNHLIACDEMRVRASDR
jgi:hypothetical protein